MLLKIGMGLAVVLIAFLGYVASRDGRFRYERSGVIKAPPDKIFPYLTNFKLGGEWSPYEKKDPAMNKTYSGTDGQPGSIFEFDSKTSGSGRIEILRTIPNELVELKLTMLKPFQAENLVLYKLTPEAEGTRFSWIMSGDGGFMTKLIDTLMDCEKMVTADFEPGIQNLKTLVESKLSGGAQ